MRLVAARLNGNAFRNKSSALKKPFGFIKLKSFKTKIKPIKLKDYACKPSPIKKKAF